MIQRQLASLGGRIVVFERTDLISTTWRTLANIYMLYLVKQVKVRQQQTVMWTWLEIHAFKLKKRLNASVL